MKDELISFETAKLAKEVGFDEYCIDTFNAEGVEQDRYNLEVPAWTADEALRELFENNNSMLAAIGKSRGNKPYISRPSQSLLQRWLRETHNLNPVPKEIHIGEITLVKKYIDGFGQDDVEYDTYEECLEVGLMKCLIHIKKLHYER